MGWGRLCAHGDVGMMLRVCTMGGRLAAERVERADVGRWGGGGGGGAVRSRRLQVEGRQGIQWRLEGRQAARARCVCTLTVMGHAHMHVRYGICTYGRK